LAYKKIFYHFYPRLFKFCNQLIQNAESSEELTADMILKLWLMGNKLADIENINIYLFRAIKNSALTYLTKNKPSTTPITTVEETLGGGYDSESPTMLSEASMLLEKSVASLPTQCQTVFRLIREEGFSYKEVTQIVGISQNTIETHMRIALKRIRLSLDTYLELKKK